ncbi:hypothetical protein OKW29_001606 [Paraburkholderia sp. CI3]
MGWNCLSTVAYRLSEIAPKSWIGFGDCPADIVTSARAALQTAAKALGSACLLRLAWRIARSEAPNAGNGAARPVTN